MSSKLRRRALGALASLAMIIVGIVGTSSPANAEAQTCITATGGTVCTHVYGNNGWVDAIGISHIKVDPFEGNLLGICNYRAWYFAYQPGGPVQDLGTEQREGCGIGRVWLIKQLHHEFPLGTEVCAKFYENDWQDFIGQKCVGLG